jgi:hypothetical protein
LLASAGLASALWPVQSVEHATRPWQSLAWTGFFMLGGLASALGVITDRWLGELVGLPMLITVFAFYSVVAFSAGKLPSLAGGCFLLAVGVLLFVRWQQVWEVRRVAAAASPGR